MRTKKAALLTKERTKSEIDDLITLLNLKGDERLLDIGCGWARHVIELTRRGYQVAGVDISQAMIDRGKDLLRQQNLKADLTVCDMANLAYSSEFDIALSLFGSFGYADTDQDSLNILTKIRESLIPGGRLCLELWNRDKYINMSGQNVFHRHEGLVILEEHLFDSIAGRMNITRTIVEGSDSREYKLSVRLYTYSELHQLLTAAGFQTRTPFGSLRGEPFTPESPKTVIICTNSG